MFVSCLESKKKTPLTKKKEKIKMENEEDAKRKMEAERVEKLNVKKKRNYDVAFIFLVIIQLK